MSNLRFEQKPQFGRSPRGMMTQGRRTHWGRTCLIAVLCAIGMAVAYDVFLRWRESRLPHVALSDAIGIYSRDLTQFYPPGSLEAKQALLGLAGYLTNADLKTDRPIYMREFGPPDSTDLPLMWDFPLSEEMKKRWQEKIRANTPSEGIRR